MTYPTPEDINQIALECGITSGTARTAAGEIANYATASQLQAFFLRGIEMGRKMQREIDVQIAYPKNGKSDWTREAAHAALIAEAIRNNTGE